MKEKEVAVASGWVMLPVAILAWLAIPFLFYLLIAGSVSVKLGLPGLALLIPLAILLSWGFFTLQPNEARVLVLFGKYKGTVRKDGFHWANPFSVHRGPWETTQGTEGGAKVVKPRNKYRVSLRARNFQTETLKVNDQRGNPIEIGAVVVWHVSDTAQALFDVDDYENYVQVQSESAVRHLANSYPYDHSEDEAGGEITLRDSSETINAALQDELQKRLEKAGVAVDEARLTHLAYAPEIAGAMLRRQQAEAIIAARRKIVHGAVSMVEMALSELSAKRVVEMNEDRKAAMVANLLVVLCSEAEAEPVINTGLATK